MTRTWKTTKERTLRSYREGRKKLIEELGSKCQYCPETDFSKLEFHHTEPRDWIPSKMNRWTRLANYKRDAARGVIELACRSCNASIGHPCGSGEPF